MRARVVHRASSACEYCLVNEHYATFAYQIDHIIAKKHGGTDIFENLANSCVQCNRFKGSDIALIDPESGELVPLFNPRTEKWNEHFRLDGFVIVPLTPIGRATVSLL